jgi:hypothetical protein
MDRKTILLYNLDDPENALELAFQQRYGHIVAFKWFRDGYVMVGFSLGYLVVISTRTAPHLFSHSFILSFKHWSLIGLVSCCFIEQIWLRLDVNNSVLAFIKIHFVILHIVRVDIRYHTHP